MFLRLLALISSLMITVSAIAADITLQIPEHFELLSINGKDVKGNLSQRAQHYTLGAGETLLELRYNDIQEASIGDSHTIFHSNPVGVRFTAEANHSYALKAPRPDNEQQANLFSKNPQFNIIDVATSVAIPQQYLNSVDFKKGILAALSNAAAPAVVEIPVAPKSSAAASNTDLVSQNLWFWWQQADEATRKAFLKRIAE